MRKELQPGRGLLIPIIVITTLAAAGAARGQAAKPEDAIRATLLEFQKGVEAGDRAVGQALAARGPYQSGFLQLYDSLADVYSRNRMIFPVEIGHVKILEDGRAKVETYINPGRNLFVFTLVREDGRWKFFHMEGIRFPVYEVPRLPASSVYEIPPETVQWMMCERDVAFDNELWSFLKASLGEARARSFFVQRAVGFKTAMDAWLPFLEGAARFAVFYGIIEQNYYGSKYVLIRASVDEAEIRFSPLQSLEVMKIANFTPKMTIDEYQAFYGDIMRERARVCGLDLEVAFAGTDCTLKLKRIKAS